MTNQRSFMRILVATMSQRRVLRVSESSEKHSLQLRLVGDTCRLLCEPRFAIFGHSPRSLTVETEKWRATYRLNGCDIAVKWRVQNLARTSRGTTSGFWGWYRVGQTCRVTEEARIDRAHLSLLPGVNELPKLLTRGFR